MQRRAVHGHELNGATMRRDFFRAIVVVGFSILIAACGSSGEGGSSTVQSTGSATTYYVDPTCGVNGDGTTTTCGARGPFNSWANVSPWAAGNTYAGKGGDSETFTTYSIQASGTPGNPITITSYGTGQFTFVSTTTVPLASTNKSYVTIDNVAINATTNHCLYFGGVASHVTVKNSTFIQCGIDGKGTAGITIDAQYATAQYTHFTVDNNNFTDITGPAFYMQIANTNNLIWDNISITNNNMTNVDNGSSTLGAIRVLMDDGTTATLTNLAITGNLITRVNDELNSNDAVFPPHAITVRRGTNPHPLATPNLFQGVNVSNNTITGGAGGIYGSHWGILANGPRNTISHNTLSNLYTAAGIGFNDSTGILVSYNTIDNMTTGFGLGYWDGMGIDIDYGSSQIEAAHNLIQHCLGATSQKNETQDTPAELSGEGISTFETNTSFIHANLLIGNRHGLVVGDESSLDLPFSPGLNVWANNTVINSTFSGIDLVCCSALPQAHHFINNIVVGSGAAGYGGYGFRNLSKNSQITQIMTTNLFFDNASGDYFRQSIHATDITGSDPLFVGPADYRLQAASPARSTGTYWGSQCSDIRGHPCVPGQMSIGAYQP